MISVDPPAHPAAALFPPLSATEYAALLASIREDGQLEAIVLHEGQILDGRHRWRACREAGIEPHTRAYMGECGTPLRFVLAENLSRRHLTPSQAATIAVEALPLFEAEAKERQREAGQSSAPGRPAEKLPADLREVSPPRREREAASQAGATVGVSARTVQNAKAVKERAPDLFAQVQAGALTVDAASKEAAKRKAVAEQAESDRLLGIVGDPEGRIARAELRTRFSRARAAVARALLDVDIAATAPLLDVADWDSVTLWIGETRRFLAALEAARPSGLRLVAGRGS